MQKSNSSKEWWKGYVEKGSSISLVQFSAATVNYKKELVLQLIANCIRLNACCVLNRGKV